MSGEELRALAEAATQDEWWQKGQYIRAGRDVLIGCDNEVDAAFIAAANPTAVLAMLDERDALRAQVERAWALADEYECGGTCSSEDPEWVRCISCRLNAALDGPQ